MGGVGKTQLAIAYAQRYDSNYTSVLWLNATSETTLYASFRSVARVLNTADTELDNEQIISHVHGWLSDPDNTQWLLIFDNHDDPDQFDLDSFCPNVGHGSIVITTRLPDMLTGEQVRVRLLDGLDDGLQILQTRSGRQNVASDTGARGLAARLAGLPLALATAGAYLRKRTISFQQYLDTYEQRWQIDPHRLLQLHEYQDRTLYTTWDLTFNRLEIDDPQAAQMLMLLAYFDNQGINYKLLCAAPPARSPEWLQPFVEDEISFESLMGTLVEYSLVDIQHATQSYSLHNCIHDWTLRGLSQKSDPSLYWYAFDCVAANTDKTDWYGFEVARHMWITRHALRLTNPHFKSCVIASDNLTERLVEVVTMVHLLVNQAQVLVAEQLCKQALSKSEEMFGCSHEYSLGVVDELGSIYMKQRRLDDAERIYTRALVMKEKNLGLDHFSTLTTVHNLGVLYSEQRRIDEAENMWTWALEGLDRARGPEDNLTLGVLANLGRIHHARGDLNSAEEMYTRALAGYEKVAGPKRVTMVKTIFNLATLYLDQRKLAEAERMFAQALTGFEKTLGPDHTLVFRCALQLGLIYGDQGKLHDAEKLCTRALVGFKKTLGPDDVSTLHTAWYIASVYNRQGRLDEAEQWYHEALAGYARTLGPDHPMTISEMVNLGQLYRTQGRLNEAEQMYTQALASCVKGLEPGHAHAGGYPNPSLIMKDLSELYRLQGNSEEAERIERQREDFVNEEMSRLPLDSLTRGADNNDKETNGTNA